VERFFERRGGTTILIGRFIGLVRAIAPFIAGASRMPLRKFLPYDIVGAGAWATTFCVLGFVFWRSFDQLTAWVSRGLFAFALVVALIAGIVFLVRVQRDPALRERTGRWLAAQLEKPLLRPFAPALRAAWRRVVRPAADVAEAPARFVWNRLTPGDFGLELTTLLAAGAVGSFAFYLNADLLDERARLPGDALAADIAGRIDAAIVLDAAEVFTALASLPVVAVLVAATTVWALARRRRHEAVVLPAALALTWAAVEIAKDALDRPRPSGSLVETTGAAYPSAHAAYAVFYVACAVVLVRAGSGLAARFAVVTFALVLAVALALSRVLLRASHLSDVAGGAGLATAVLALLGLVAIAVTRLRHNVRPEP
jgi:undecaprenyl-diphosphatase